MATQTRIHSIKSALPPLDQQDRLQLDSMQYQEQLGRPFECIIHAVSRDHSINEDDLLGTSFTVIVEPTTGSKKFFNGLVCEVDYLGIAAGYSRYRIVTRPWFWLLTHTTDSRVFQDKTTVELITEICKTTHGFSDFKVSTTGQFPKRTYCVQYQESDFDFISRLLEEEGIYYYVDHEEGKHTVVFVDDTASLKAIDGGADIPFRLPGDAPVELKHISQWASKSQLLSTEVTLDDYDFESPKANLSSKSSISRKHQLAKFEKYEFPGRYVEKSRGEALAKRRVEKEQSDTFEFHGTSDRIELACGYHFKMIEHPRQDQNDVDLLVTRLSVEVVSAEIELFSSRENAFQIGFAAIKKSSQFRPQRATARPVVVGPQSAQVVGKSGKEIWTDEFGRVKVQFPWDREGESNENSSCWVRVSQSWAGNGFGAVHIPRIGQEVLVEFLDGDPDRPIVTGRVYNADVTTPYKLPDNATQSGFKTKSSEKGTAENYNELRFEDKKDSEEIYLHAEKDFTKVVENNSSEKIGFEKKDEGNQTVEVHGTRTIKVATGDELIEITQGDRTVETKAGKQLIKAMESIELVVGGSSIKIESSKITISAPVVEVNATTSLDATSPLTSVDGSSTLTLTGGIVKIN